MLRGNYVHDNDGPGLWTDVNNIYTTFENNLVENNTWAGIFHEVSYDAVIRNNVSRGNGFGSSWVYDGAGILAASSPNVEIYNNVVENNKNGVILYMVDRSGDKQTAGPHITQNNYVHNNTISMPSGVSGLVQHVNDDTYFTSKQNRFASNTYYLGSISAQRYFWMNATKNKDQWKSYGQDTSGSFLP
jgi:parallel beta-helix repeat protein